MKTLLLSALAAAALLAACGGGSDDAAAEAVPDSASASVAGMTAWLLSLVREDSQTREPLDAAPFQPPTPEADEPQDLAD